MDTAGFMAALNGISGLEVDFAVANIGSSDKLYEQLLISVIRALPANLSATDRAIAEGDIKAFGLKSHGMKGSFNQVGALALAKQAEALETAAKNGDTHYCGAYYGSFKEAVLCFYTQVNQLMLAHGLHRENEKALAGSANDFIEALLEARAAAAGFESLPALKRLKPLARYDLGEQANGLVQLTIDELEAFRPRKAVPYLTKLLEIGGWREPEAQAGQ